jgi:hypothetical protein
MRDEAVKEMKAAINSTKLKLQNKEVELASSNSPDDNDITRAQIAEVKEIVAEMEGRVSSSVYAMLRRLLSNPVVCLKPCETLEALSTVLRISRKDGTFNVLRV